MMNSIKAILGGILFILISTVILQLIYIIVAVVFNSIAKDVSFLKENSWVFNYLIAMPAFIAIMFFGGYITAKIANAKALYHCLVVGIIVVGGEMWSALANSSLTIKGLLLSATLVLVIVAGGSIANKASLKSTP